MPYTTKCFFSLKLEILWNKKSSHGKIILWSKASSLKLKF